ncbi:DUF4232 domain-containing protein [Streptomyces sp. HGB0020]|uniref:DUF4232 domain-containing protein n=1 Tax=Streptomyces sp. HGB0020 TaxID=1078086 RepID=UPI00034E48E3|nr:DUF4232 domain-containing protein [Streptomyces sp. HGB0020]EPD56421.1 hypothetical protein HMPREF1211_07542 [Streptomyces sp. HGB0020]
MRASSLTVAALAAALLLSACDDGGDSGGDGGGSSAGRAGGACTLGHTGVQIAASAAPSAGDTGTVTVTLTNQGAECTLDGFPGVGLRAGGASSTVPADRAAKAQKLTLAKDATASFTITYVRGGAGAAKSLAVRTGTFALPGSDDKHSFTWSYGDVALKGGGDEPNASVTAFQQSGD